MRWNRSTALLLAALMLALTAGCAGVDEQPEPEVHVPPNAVIGRGEALDNTTPSGAVAGLLDAVVHWDMGVAAQFVSGGDDAQFSAYQAVLLPFIERIDYELGAEKVTGDTAVVDVAITAVDAGNALGELTVAAARYAIAQALTGQPADMQQFVAEYLSDTLDFDNLTRQKRFAPVHLVQDTMGRWRLDASNPDNATFYNALSGGALETVAGLVELAEQYELRW